MKAYEEVVRERYDGREKSVHIYDTPYSLINPIGFHGSLKIREAFYKIFNELRDEGMDITSKKILDIGCGSGGWTRFFADLTGSTENIMGIDLSTYRIELARKFNPAIKYSVGDITKISYKNEFDIISAIDVFQHLNNEDQIMSALNGINNSLEEDGIFIWYDIYADDHFKSPDGAESQGYHPKQMEGYCRRSGFTKLFSLSLFKRFGRYHTLYFHRRLPAWLVSMIEMIPGSPGNIIIVFKKSRV